MQGEATQLLFALLRSAILDTELTEAEQALFSAEILPSVKALAKLHDVSHLLASGLRRNGLSGADDKSIEEERNLAIYRFEQLDYEFETLCEALESAGYDFLPLKGAVIRRYYRAPWMRTSCDIDILVKEESLDEIAAFLVEKQDYVQEGKGRHDISLKSPSQVHIELHYDLMEDGFAMRSADVLKDVWAHTTPKDGYRHFYEMSKEMFYFYHIAHMAKHFEQGGCGIKPFLDLWVMPQDLPLCEELFQKAGLWTFANAVDALNQVFLGRRAHDSVTAQMEAYLLRGGVYGTVENRVVVEQRRRGGKFRYAMSKIFLSYDILKFQYPILQKHRWLTPFMEVRRWCKLIFCGHARRTVRELNYNRNLSQAQIAENQRLFDSIGL